MCSHFGDVTVFVRRVGAVKVEHMAASFLVVFPGFDVDVYSHHGARVSGFVGVLCGNYDPVRYFELYAFGSEPMLAFARVQVFGHARDHGEAR